MSGSLGLSPIQALITYGGNEAKYAAANAIADPQANNLIAYFTKNAPGITSPQALLKDYKALSVVLGAFGLGSQISETALISQLLTQDPKSTTSLAYQSGNVKYLEFATALHSFSPPPFADSAGLNSVLNAYKNNLFEASAGQQTPGLTQALYFQRSAGAITSLTQLQSDPELLAVAVTAVGLPLSAFQNLSFDQQTRLLQSKLTIANLQKPSYVDHLAQLYVVQQQLNNGYTTPTVQPGSLLGLFTPATSGASTDLLTIVLNSEASGTSSSTSLLGTTTASNDPILSLFA